MNTERNTGKRFIGFLEETDIQVGDWLEGKVTRNIITIRDITVDYYQGEILQQKGYYLTKIEFEEKKALQIPNQSIIYNLNGANTRVNNHSKDYSVNIINMSSSDLFDEVRRILTENVTNQEELRELRLLVNDMENNQNTPRFIQAYTKFITSAADHITVLSPVIPALTQIIS